MIKSLFIFVFFVLFSCEELSNSSSGDTASAPPPPNVSEEFAAATQILNAKCKDCHTGYNHSFSGYVSESDYQDDNNNVVAGNISSSRIYTKLSNATPAGNMPTGGVEWSDEERDIIIDWINSIE